MSRFWPFTTMCWRKMPSKVKPQAQGGAAAGLILRIALPLVAAVAEVFKDVAGHQVHGFSGRGGALQRRRQQDVAHLNHAVGLLHAHVAGIAGGEAELFGISAKNKAALPLSFCTSDWRSPLSSGIGAVGEPGPQLIVTADSFPEGRGMARGVERLEGDGAAV